MIKGDKLGEGSYGIVYSIKSPVSKKEYALKRNFAEDNISFMSSIRELDILYKLCAHPNIINLKKISYGDNFMDKPMSPIKEDRKNQRNDDIHFIFNKADYDLHDFIYKYDYNINKAIFYMVQLLLGLEYIHSKKIIHRDIKATNILIFEKENLAKICDFGFSTPFTNQGNRTPGLVTTIYRPPEITLGNPKYNYKIDIWSLGCIFFELVSKNKFIHTSDENNDKILTEIISKLPKPLTSEQVKELNKYRKVRIGKRAIPKRRKSLFERLNLKKKNLNEFPDIKEFCNLLNNMLEFDFNKRFSATECLNHIFFKNYKNYIDETRSKFPISYLEENKLIINNTIQRKWIFKYVIEIYNKRKKLEWYSHRILFQAIDLAERYLLTIKGNEEEYEIKIKFYICLYISIKYFCSFYFSYNLDTLINIPNKDFELQVKNFEGGFIKNYLKNNIYRTTVYEAADSFNYNLNEEDIRKLLIMYIKNIFVNHYPSEIFLFFKKDK